MNPDPNGCGAHYMEEKPFDYTCDDCMLPANHIDPKEINNNMEERMNIKREATESELIDVLKILVQDRTIKIDKIDVRRIGAKYKVIVRGSNR